MRPLLLLTTLPLIASCSNIEPPPPPPPIDVLVRVTTDATGAGKPVPGAALLIDGKKVAATGEGGTATLSLKGKEGDSYDVAVSCPDGFKSPQKPVSVIVRRLADNTKKPEYAVTCSPTSRTVVVAVRVDGAKNSLPIKYLGREVARTDASGAAHVVLKVKADEPFELAVDTSEKGNELLRPQSPVASFTPKNQDEVLTLDQKFTMDAVRAVSTRGGRAGPVKITN
jgi:hypothetical protein